MARGSLLAIGLDCSVAGALAQCLGNLALLAAAVRSTSTVCSRRDCPDWMDRGDGSEVPLVVDDQDAVVGFGHCRDKHIQGAAWTTFGRAFGHQARPNQGRAFVERENAPGKQRLESFWPRKPGLEFATFSAFPLLKDPASDLADREGRNEKILVLLLRQPPQERFQRRGLGCLTNDIGVEEVASHRSASRPGVISRVRSRSAPTSGERRKAARMPPLWGASAMLRCTSARSRTANPISFKSY